MKNVLDALRAKAVKLNDQAVALRAMADEAGRELTAEELGQVSKLVADFDAIMGDIDSREKLAAQSARLAQPEPRIVTGSHAPVTAGRQGFRHFGEYLKAVRATDSGRFDARLQAAVTVYGNEAADADGGYAVPPDFRPDILKELSSFANIFPMLDQITATSAAVTLPTDQLPPWATTGIQVGTVVEGAAFGVSKPILGKLTLSVAKVGGLVFITNEMLEDVPNIGGYVAGKANEVLGWNMASQAFSAIIGAGSKVSIAKTAAAAAASPADLTNLQNMFAGMPQQWQSRGVWLANPRYQVLLQALTAAAATPTFPAYLPPGGISQAPYATLFGRPVIFTELCAAVGTVGDIVFFDPMGFYGVTKSSGVRFEVSREADGAFAQDLTVYRIATRIVAASKFSAPLTRPDATTVGNVVVLATRA